MDSQLEFWAFVVVTILFAASEALGKSKRFKANGVIQLIAEVVNKGSGAALQRSPAGIAATIVTKAGEYIEDKIEEKLDEGVKEPEKVEQPKPKPASKPAAKIPPPTFESAAQAATGGRTTPGRRGDD